MILNIKERAGRLCFQSGAETFDKFSSKIVSSESRKVSISWYFTVIVGHRLKANSEESAEQTFNAELEKEGTQERLNKFIKTT